MQWFKVYRNPLICFGFILSAYHLVIDLGFWGVRIRGGPSRHEKPWDKYRADVRTRAVAKLMDAEFKTSAAQTGQLLEKYNKYLNDEAEKLYKQTNRKD